MPYTPYTANLLRSALIDFHQFVYEHPLPVSGYLAEWDETLKDQVQQLVDCNDELIREYAEELWRRGFRLNQAYIVNNNDMERTLYAKGDDGGNVVIAADV